MPLDVEDAAGSSNNLASLPSNSNAFRILFLNDAYHAGRVLPALAPRPNPSSELGWAPGTNVVLSQRGKAWTTSGLFIITSEITKGYEMAPNWNLRIQEQSPSVTSNVDVRNPAATTTFYSNPYDFASYIQTALNADATLAGTYTVTYSGYRTSSPTYKFTISCTQAFRILVAADANTCATSLGWTGDTGYATSQTSTNVAIHTEEYIIIDLNSNIEGTKSTEWAIGSTSITNRFRWLVLVDLNNTGIGSATAGGDKVHVYFSDAFADIDNKNDSTYTEHRDMFKLGVTSGTDLGVNEGSDAGSYISNITTTGKPVPANYYVVDLKGWRAAHNSGADAYAPNYRFLRIKVVNRTNPNGCIKLGYLFCGPGMYLKRNIHYQHDITPVSTSGVELSELGAQFHRGGTSYTTQSLEWGEENPLDDADALLIRKLLVDARMKSVDILSSSTIIKSSSLHPMVVNPYGAAASRRSVIVIDPAETNADDNIPGGTDAYTKFGEGTMFGTLTVESLDRISNKMYGAKMEFTEEPMVI